jgi:hypothetical protein
MTPELLQKVGEALHGPLWRAELARGLSVSERSIRRWANGDSEIPPNLNQDLARLCRQHSDRLGNLAAKLEKLR